MTKKKKENTFGDWSKCLSESQPGQQLSQEIKVNKQEKKAKDVAPNEATLVGRAGAG